MAIVMKSLLLMNNLVYTVKLCPKSLVLHLAYYLQRSRNFCNGALYLTKKRGTMRPSLTENLVHPNLRISEPSSL